MTKNIKDRWVTIRIPPDVELALRRQAGTNTRTLAAQVLHYIIQGVKGEIYACKPDIFALTYEQEGE